MNSITSFLSHERKLFYVLLLLVMFVMGCFSSTRGLWGDEASLLANIVEIDFKDILEPLPFYAQASPLLPLLLQKATFDLTGGDIYILRLSILATSFFAVIFFLRIANRSVDYDWRFWVLGLSLSTFPYLLYSTEIKHYIYEFVSSLFIILGYLALWQKKQKEALCFILLSLLWGFSNLIPVGMLILFWTALDWFDGQRRFPNILRLIMCGVVLGLFYVHLKFLTAYQVSSYQDVYSAKGFIGDAKDLIRSAVGIHGLPLLVLTCTSLIVGLTRNKLDKFYFSLSLFYVSIVSAICLLKFLGKYPVIYDRHLLWLVPFSISLSSLFIKSFLSDLKWKTWSTNLFCLGVFIVGGIKVVFYERIESNELIAKAEKLCNHKSVNLIGAPNFDKFLYSYKSSIGIDCVNSDISLFPSRDLKDSYPEIINDRIGLFDRGKENYLILPHFDLGKDEHRRNKSLNESLASKGLKYEVHFQGKSVAILRIYESSNLKALK
jgi:hypothetical protein